jgi:hypothetical protein
MTLKVGDRFLVVSIRSRHYGQKGEVICIPDNSEIISVYLDVTGNLIHRVNRYGLQKI